MNKTVEVPKPEFDEPLDEQLLAQQGECAACGNPIGPVEVADASDPQRDVWSWNLVYRYIATNELMCEECADALEREPDTQECQGCYQRFPAEDPMIDVFDCGDFCSWACVAEFAAEQTHCWTHDDLVQALSRTQREA